MLDQRSVAILHWMDGTILDYGIINIYQPKAYIVDLPTECIPLVSSLTFNSDVKLAGFVISCLISGMVHDHMPSTDVHAVHTTRSNIG